MSLVLAGALELRNYPTALRNLQLPPAGKAQWPSGQDPPQRLLDMGAVDVWRSRESRIPLFNDYLKVRRCLGKAGISPLECLLQV